MGEKIRPVKGERNVLITSALPYVNNVPHLGNLIGSVLSADVFSRYNKRRGYNTLYICGTDEYGTATETKALDEGVTPQEVVDKYHKIHKGIYDWFDIEFDYFGRTTTETHTRIVQEMFLDIRENGYFKEFTTKQPFCENHNGFLADRYIQGTCYHDDCLSQTARGDQCDDCGNLIDPLQLKDPYCVYCTKALGYSPPPPVPRDTKHIFLALDDLQEDCKVWFEKSSQEGKWSPNGAAIAKSWFDKDLHPRSITRDLKWGIKIPLPEPEWENKVIYVWFDACIGYPSITACYDPEGWKQWWKAPEDVKLFQFMGKDNTPFHACTFPACQIASEKKNPKENKSEEKKSEEKKSEEKKSEEKWTMVHNISTTEYLNYEGGKFSKSRNIGVFGDQAQQTKVPASVWRYALLSARPETGDTQFEWSAFVTANNSVLLNNLGNFVNRIIKFVNAKFEGVVPGFSADYTDGTFDFPQWRTEVNELLKVYVDDMEGVHLRSGLSKIMAISSKGNDLLQYRLDNANLAEHPERTHTVIGLALNLCGLIAAIVSPFMPATAKSIAEQLNVELPLIPDSFGTDVVLSGHKIGKAAYLFSRIDEKKIKEWQEQFGGTSEERAKEKANEAAEKKKKQEGKDRKKAKKVAMKAAEAAGGADQKTHVDLTNEAAAMVSKAAVQAKDAVVAAATGEANTGATAAAPVEAQTVATEERKALPIRTKPVGE